MLISEGEGIEKTKPIQSQIKPIVGNECTMSRHQLFQVHRRCLLIAEKNMVRFYARKICGDQAFLIVSVVSYQ